MTSPDPDEFLPIRYTDSDRKDLRFLSFGAGGFTLYTGDHSRLSGYRTRENFFKPSKWWTHQHRELEDPRLFEGLPWMDMTHLADSAVGRSMSIRGPLVGPHLRPGERETLSGLQDSAWKWVGLQGEFAAIFRLACIHEQEDSKRPGPLDQVSIEEYCFMWRQVGAHVGTIQAGVFVEIDCPGDPCIDLRPIKVWFDDGDFVETSINGTREDIFKYYVGQQFEKSDETLHMALSVEFLEPQQ